MLKRIGFTRNDLILVAALLVFAAFGAWRGVNIGVSSAVAEKVIIRVNGEVLTELPLDEDRELGVTGYDGGFNVVTITNREVYIREADCPDLLCVKHAPASERGELIVCLPHRIAVELE
ncbi:MAG: NusG domain II-containing protein [Oscillospiraceae bacterium]|jgi:hypothetical protein|nr:NusG domain II-containing protein [Oscillospiraceae bacterium]